MEGSGATTVGDECDFLERCIDTAYRYRPLQCGARPDRVGPASTPKLRHRLKALKGSTHFECVCKIYTIEPERFTLSPTHQMSEPNT